MTEVNTKSVNDAIGTVSGVASAGGGIMTYLNENAAAIGLIFTGLTFLVFLISKAISVSIELTEHRERIKKIKQPE